ncbi:MAG: hypothetical protein Q9191_002101 [Dirinaria sp. TL-2023a]
MPWSRLRVNRPSDAALRRHSTLDPANIPGDARTSTSHDGGVDPMNPVRSSSPLRNSIDPAGAAIDDSFGAKPLRDPSPNRRQQRSSMLKFRHASDSQLAKTAKEQATVPPPMPNAPSIITTAPTGDVDQPPKKKSTFTLPRRQKITGTARSLTARSSRTSLAEKRPESTQQLPRSQNQSARASRLTFDDPLKHRDEDQERLRSAPAPPAYGDHANSTMALPVTRLSESSRSDGSGDHGLYATTTTTHTVSTTTTIFRLPRRKKNKGPLFPLPVKIPPPDASLTPSLHAPTPGLDSAYESSRRPSSTATPPLTAVHRPGVNEHDISNLPSPLSPSSPALLEHPMPRFAPSSDSASPRQSTTTSRSGRSSPGLVQPGSQKQKGRSPTKGSLRGVPDDESLPTPAYDTSGRNSSSTTGRSSLGGLFNLSRLRHNSEPQTARLMSNHPPVPGTPISAGSKSQSFSLSREPIIVPEREEGDTPSKYLARLREAVSRGVVATILSKSDDEFLRNALRSYMRGFKFFGDPMDMAIRKLLMEVELPKETQQIDRVLQSFANRYHECNPGVFASTDEAYFIAFSILILHTDAFNKNNKHKMQKPDYCKNARGQGVAEEILECFYDNISYTPFIHVEDDLDINGERIVAKPRKSVFNRGGPDSIGRGSREPVDPYTLILDSSLDTLRPSLKDVMNLDDPYTYLGTAPSLNIADLHNSFFKSGVLQIVSSRSRPDAFMSPETVANPAEAHPGVVDIKVTKVGVLWRKDPKKKKARSPWQEWGAILTGAQLYFFRNTAWIKNLMHQQDSHRKLGLAAKPVTFKPPLEQFKPDVMMSTEDAVALVDATYKKHKHAFLFVRHGGFEEVFLADNESDMNDWLSKLNYASTFKTAGVRMRAVIGSHDDPRSRGIHRMDSSTSTQSVRTASGGISIRNPKIDDELAQQIQTARRQIMAQKIEDAENQLEVAGKQLDGQLRNARHLQVLAPIQNKTREQIILAAGGMAAKIKWLRLEIWRTRCHKDILALDLEEEGKSTDPGKAFSIKSGPRPIGKRDSNNAQAISPPNSPKTDKVARPSIQPASGATLSMDNVFRSPSHASPPQSQKPKGSWELPPLSFDPAKALKSEPTNGATAAVNPALHHRISQTSVRGSEKAPSLAELAARLATPTPSIDDDEQAVLKEAGVVLPESPSNKPIRPGTAGSDTAKDQDQETAKASGLLFNEDRPKIRRSLQRTLRDSHHSHHSVHHHRSKKGKESASSGVGTEDASSLVDSEGLARGTGSFTVHGKKASVITFGAEWQDMSPEERLKVRRSAHGEDSKLAVPIAVEDERLSVRSASESDARPISAISISSATTRSIGPAGPLDDTDDLGRSLSNDVGPDEIRRAIPPSPLMKEAKEVDLDEHAPGSK